MYKLVQLGLWRGCGLQEGVRVVREGDGAGRRRCSAYSGFHLP